MPVPSKAEQIQEANAHRPQGMTPEESAAYNNERTMYADAANVIDDVARGPDDGAHQRQAPQQDDQPQRQAPQPRVDDKRNEIVARFRAHRDERNEADRDDISDFARSGMPPEFDHLREVDDAPPLAPADAAPVQAVEPHIAEEAPKVAPRIKLKVHGEEKEYALDEVIAQAQIALASDNILGKAKTRLQEVDDLLRDTRNKVARPDQNGHQTDQTRTQPTDNSSQDDGSHTSDDPYDKLIETIQFGDPTEAKPLLRKTIANEASREVTQQLQAERMKNEGVRAGKVIAEFSAKYPDLASDESANAVMQSRIYRIQLSDLESIGVTPQSLEASAGRQVTAGDIAEAHKWYRAEGFSLKTPEVMLQESYDHLLKWKGPGAATPQPQPAETERAPPRVEVNLNRDTRRAAIPQSPTRTAVPMQPPQGQPGAQRRDPSLVIQQMQQKRDAPKRGVAV